MRSTTIALAALLSGSVLTAQQEFELRPGMTSFFYRGALDSSAGDLMQGVHAEYHRGIGGNATGCWILGIRGYLQDQNTATQESFHWVIRSGTDAGGPTPGTGGLITRVGPLQTPTGSGVQAWLVTSTFAAPVMLPDCRSFFAFGVSLPPAPAWTGFLDGLSTWAARGDGANSVQQAHARAEDHAWQIAANSTAASHPWWQCTIEMRLLVATPVLQVGQGGLVYGMGGMFPEAGRPLTVRTRLGSAGVSVLYLGTSRTNGIPLFGGSAPLYLAGITLPLGTMPTDSTGEAVHAISASLPGTLANSGTAYLQAAGLTGAGVALTNAWSIKP